MRDYSQLKCTSVNLGPSEGSLKVIRQDFYDWMGMVTHPPPIIVTLDRLISEVEQFTRCVHRTILSHTTKLQPIHILYFSTAGSYSIPRVTNTNKFIYTPLLDHILHQDRKHDSYYTPLLDHYAVSQCYYRRSQQ